VFEAGGASLPAVARAHKAARVAESLKRGEGHGGDQHQVWKDVRDFVRRAGVITSTMAMHSVYERRREVLARARRALGPGPAQAGAIIYAGGRWVGLDVLASPGLFARAWARLYSGYAADGERGRARSGLSPSPETVLQRVGRASIETAPAVGLGQEYRLGSQHVRGAALVAEGRVAHLMAFPARIARARTR
jgi:hypothetical protein